MAINSNSAAVTAAPSDGYHDLSALDRYRSEFAALGDQNLRCMNIDIVSVAMLVLKRWPTWQPYLPRIRRLDGADIESIEKLPNYAEAAVAAHNEYAATVNPELDLKRKYEEANALRERLRCCAQVLEYAEVIPKGSLDKLRNRQGYRNVTTDLGTLVAVFMRHWEATQGKTPVTRTDVERAQVLIQELLHNAAERDVNHASVIAAALLRKQALTKLMDTYEELRACLQFILRGTGKADDVVPSLYSGRGGRKRIKPTSTSTEVSVALPSAAELGNTSSPNIGTTSVSPALPPGEQERVEPAPPPVGDPNALPSAEPFMR